MHKHIHLVCFNHPYPPNYGGVIDVFYKIKALHQAGIIVTLHVFEYNRSSRGVLETLCDKVYYYPRPTGLKYQFSVVPFIVNTRKNKELLQNLCLDSDPILFDGLHCTYHLNHPLLQDRQRVVRTHNVEHIYYSLLAQREKSILMKIYLWLESRKLRRYESVLNKADWVACISSADEAHFKKINLNSAWVGAFHPFDQVKSKIGIGDYMLYHGNLEVAENLEAINYIITKVMPGLNIPLYIAGKNPHQSLSNLVNKNEFIHIVANPTDEELEVLIMNAQINLLPTFQPTGLKLKLLYSLFVGKHVIASPLMLAGSGLDTLCCICANPSEFRHTILELIHKPFDKEMVAERQAVLANQFLNTHNSARLIEMLFPTPNLKKE
jgi:hypothetical protein